MSVMRVSLDQHVARRLGEMGLVKGASVRLVSRDESSVVVSVGGSRLALGGQMARCIWVSPCAHRRP